MLPYSEHQPACRFQALVRLRITHHVSFELTAPVGGVRRRAGAVLRTHVPKATVDEHRDLCRSEDEISSAVELPQRTGIDAITEPK